MGRTALQPWEARSTPIKTMLPEKHWDKSGFKEPENPSGITKNLKQKLKAKEMCVEIEEKVKWYRARTDRGNPMRKSPSQLLHGF